MSGPAPKDPSQRVNRAEKPRGDWQAAGAVGWQHGEVPKPPAKLTAAAREAWDVWMGAWFAAFWTPDDLPALRQLVRLYDQVERGEFQRHGELRIGMDTYGITPKGQQDRRWKRPEASKPSEAVVRKASGASRYEHLKVVADAVEGT
jgi:hypothetical protein